MQKNDRIEWVDLLRVIAILQVVLCHALEIGYRFNIGYMSGISIESRGFFLTAFSFGRLGVPLFLLISGYLLLDREYDYERTRRFWVNNWLKLLMCTQIWFVIYDLFSKIVLGQQITIGKIVRDALFLEQVNMNHVWYLPVILGLYVLIPFVANALNTFEIKQIAFPIIFFYVLLFIIPFMNVINSVCGRKIFSLQMSQGFSGGVYGLYFIIGYMLKKGAFNKIRTWILGMVVIASFASTVGVQMWAYSNSYAYNVWYDSPLIFITSIMVFELCSRIVKIPFYNLVRWLSKYSFGVYLVHNIFKYFLIDRILQYNVTNPVKVIVFWCILVLISYTVVWIIGKIPKIGRFLLFLK